MHVGESATNVSLFPGHAETNFDELYCFCRYGFRDRTNGPIAWASSFDSMRVSGVEKEMKRVERMNERIKIYDDHGDINGNMVTSLCMDIVKEYKDERKWDFMREGKIIIYLLDTIHTICTYSTYLRLSSGDSYTQHHLKSQNNSKYEQFAISNSEQKQCLAK